MTCPHGRPNKQVCPHCLKRQRQAPKRNAKGPVHYAAFREDLRNRTGKYTRRRSSTKGLMDYLWRTKNDPKSFNSVNDAKSK
jgi:hypothetical protein